MCYEHMKKSGECSICDKDAAARVESQSPLDSLVESLARDIDTTGLEIIKNIREISEMSVCNRTAWNAINFAKAAIATLEHSSEKDHRPGESSSAQAAGSVYEALTIQALMMRNELCLLRKIADEAKKAWDKGRLTAEESHLKNLLTDRIHLENVKAENS
jgi:hypothetical protein